MHRILSYYPEPDVTDDDIAQLLATPADRARVHRALLFADHHLLRLAYQNEHQVSDELWRSNQPGPGQLERWAERGIKTVINLRGVSTASFHVLQRDACARYGIDLVTLRIKSREAPWPGAPRAIRTMFDEIAYPALMHCKSGADRAGLMGVFYKHFRLGEPISVAREQLSWKYLHVNAGKTAILDAYLDAYITQGESQGIDIVTWSESQFDPVAFKEAFQAGALGDFVVDKVLGRE